MKCARQDSKMRGSVRNHDTSTVNLRVPYERLQHSSDSGWGLEVVLPSTSGSRTPAVARYAWHDVPQAGHLLQLTLSRTSSRSTRGPTWCPKELVTTCPAELVAVCRTRRRTGTESKPVERARGSALTVDARTLGHVWVGLGKAVPEGPVSPGKRVGVHRAFTAC